MGRKWNIEAVYIFWPAAAYNLNQKIAGKNIGFYSQKILCFDWF